MGEASHHSNNGVHPVFSKVSGTSTFSEGEASSRENNGHDNNEHNGMPDYRRASSATNSAPSGSGLGHLASLMPRIVPSIVDAILGPRVEAVLDFFGLPQGELVLDEFHCALRKRVLLQGRMYVMPHYLCFSSSVFGYVKKKVIPFEDIAHVRKKSHFRLPNSLEIQLQNGRKEFFTSFLSREEAYKLVQNTLAQQRSEAQTAAESGADAPADGQDNAIHRALSFAYMEPPSVESAALMGTPFSTAVSPASAMDEAPSLVDARSSAAGGTSMSNIMHRQTLSLDNEFEEQEEEDRMWVPQPRPAPPQHHDAKALLSTTLPGTPHLFYSIVLADQSTFIEDFLERCGNRRINITTWKRHEQLGFVRDMQFTAPIKGAFANWGVPHTQCHQSHRFALYEGEHIVFESSQTMTDIPYGDCFTVDLRWNVRPDPMADPNAPQVLFDVYIRVPFSRKCLFKKVIEMGSSRQVNETYATFISMVRPVLQEAALSPAPMTRQGSVSFSGAAQQQGPSLAGGLASANPSAAQLQQLATLDEEQQQTPSLTPHLSHQSSGAKGGISRVASQHGVALTKTSSNAHQLGDAADQGALQGGKSLPARIAGSITGAISYALDYAMASTARHEQHGHSSGGGSMRGSPSKHGGYGPPSSLSPAPAVGPPWLVPLVLLLALLQISALLWSFSRPHAVALQHHQHLPQQQLAPQPSQQYWEERLRSLQQELSLVQGRMELIGREVTAALHGLAAAGATAAAGQVGGGAGSVESRQQ